MMLTRKVEGAYAVETNLRNDEAELETGGPYRRYIKKEEPRR